MHGGKRNLHGAPHLVCHGEPGIDTGNRFHSCSTVVPQLFHSCSTVVPQLFHSCSTVAEQNAAPNQALQVFVQVLDSCFENVCELDLIYHFDRAWDLGKSQLICLASKTMLQRINGRHVSCILHIGIHIS